MSEFQYYFDRINRIPLQHTSDDFVHLSALYHQAILGDNVAPKPPVYDAVGCERWTQWTNLKGMTKDEAMDGYVAAAKDVIYKEQPLVPSAKEDVVEDAPSAVQMV